MSEKKKFADLEPHERRAAICVCCDMMNSVLGALDIETPDFAVFASCELESGETWVTCVSPQDEEEVVEMMAGWFVERFRARS